MSEAVTLVSSLIVVAVTAGFLVWTAYKLYKEMEK